MLEVKNLRVSYGTVEVLHGLSFSVSPGVVAVIGANAAGKSTMVKAIAGIIKPTAGQVMVDGRTLTGSSPAELVKAGVVLVPEGRQVFAHLSVHDNLLLGAYSVTSRDRSLSHRIDIVLEIFPELQRLLRDFAGALSGGQQQMLAVARGLMSQPRYLLLDEPSLGLAPQVAARVFSVIEALGKEGTGVLLVEQNGRLALTVASQGLLLEKGTITLSGTAEDLQANPDVIERYLGAGNRAGADGEFRSLVEGLQSALD